MDLQYNDYFQKKKLFLWKTQIKPIFLPTMKRGHGKFYQTVSQKSINISLKWYYFIKNKIVTQRKILFLLWVRRGPQFNYIKINEKLNPAKFLQMPCSTPKYTPMVPGIPKRYHTSVRPSVRLSLPPSFRPSVPPSVRPSVRDKSSHTSSHRFS